MVIVELHQLPYQRNSLIHHRLKSFCAVTQLQNGQPSIIKVQYCLAGLFEYLPGQDTRTRIEIVDYLRRFQFYKILMFGRQR
jgi:hypothetical protein